MTTVHMIGNAHLDPVWFWRWPAGVAEALLTCRTAADLLDEYPQFTFTRSDVWLYEQIEELDPRLFARIRRFVAAGRWEVVGGWYLQPDCNLPTAESFHMHMELGREHHERCFGVRATVGYNVDSFGHAATLPALLRAHGYDSYVFMRPGPHEKELPGNLFRWRSPDGSEVLAWRIHDRYNVDRVDLLPHHIDELVTRCARAGVAHVMCFYGVGNHGGGPTRSLIEWILANRTSLPGCTLEFSTTRRFFDAVKPHAASLPVVEDELQMHSIGCYSVVREVKAGVRRAEHLAAMTRRVLERFPGSVTAGARPTLTEAWRRILFNEFHDIYDGTSVPDAYVDARDQLGWAATALDSLLHRVLFRALLATADDPVHRLMVYNPGTGPFDGYIAHEPWLDWKLFTGLLTGPVGEPVPYQVVQQPSLSGTRRMILWRARVPAGEFAAFHLRHSASPAVYESQLSSRDRSLANAWWRVDAPVDAPDGGPLITLQPRDEHPLAPITLGVELMDDCSDTWSHVITGYTQESRETLTFSRVTVEESGPLRAILRGEGTCGRSEFCVHAVLHDDDPVVEIRVHASWNERMTIAKLVVRFAGEVIGRRDAIPGGWLSRSQNGYEYPVIDATVVRGAGSTSCAIVGPDSYGVDGSGSTVRYTLLRSPAYAWQGKNGGIRADEYHRWTDRGEHFMRFFILLDGGEPVCARIAERAHEPPIVTDWTVGMRSERGDGAGVAPWTG